MTSTRKMTKYLSMKPEFRKVLEAKIEEVDEEVVLVGTEEEVAQTQTQAKVDFDYIAIVKADSQELCSQSNHHAEVVAILSAVEKKPLMEAVEEIEADTDNRANAHVADVQAVDVEVLVVKLGGPIGGGGHNASAVNMEEVVQL